MSIILFYIMIIFFLIMMGIGLITWGIVIHYFILAVSQYVKKGAK